MSKVSVSKAYRKTLRLIALFTNPVAKSLQRCQTKNESI